MEVLHLIYQQFFFSANSLGRQPTPSQFFQPPSRQMILLVAAAIHCALSGQATGEKVTGMFSQDEYQGKFYPPMVINCITAEAIALINCAWWGCFILPTQGAHPVYQALRNHVGAP
jgi:F0F1-type ATP synthase membrane subunit c/vacuolar-type H+-ATPase subunit K